MTVTYCDGSTTRVGLFLHLSTLEGDKTAVFKWNATLKMVCNALIPKHNMRLFLYSEVYHFGFSTKNKNISLRNRNAKNWDKNFAIMCTDFVWIHFFPFIIEPLIGFAVSQWCSAFMGLYIWPELNFPCKEKNMIKIWFVLFSNT